MKLWLISQEVNCGYDTYDAVVVAARNENEARNVKPSDWCGLSEWAKPKDIKVELIGSALKGSEQGVILASFNAG